MLLWERSPNKTNTHRLNSLPLEDALGSTLEVNWELVRNIVDGQAIVLHTPEDVRWHQTKRHMRIHTSAWLGTHPVAPRPPLAVDVWLLVPAHAEAAYTHIHTQQGCLLVSSKQQCLVDCSALSARNSRLQLLPGSRTW
jgi:hypothetical protein